MAEEQKPTIEDLLARIGAATERAPEPAPTPIEGELIEAPRESAIPPHRFQPGNRANPAGRPKVSREMREIAQTHAPEAFDRLLMHMRSNHPKISLAACQQILDRALGKPVQGIALGLSDEGDQDWVADLRERLGNAKQKAIELEIARGKVTRIDTKKANG